MNSLPPVVYFRKPEPVDLDSLYKQKNDPEVRRRLGGFSHPLSKKDMEDWLESHRKRTDEVLWSIMDRASDRCLGHVGIYRVDPVSSSAELGIMIGFKEAWGKGIGRFAVLHAIEYAFGSMNLNRISLTVLATNERAIRLYTGLGFILEGTLRQAHYSEGAYVDIIAMGLLRKEFHGE